MSAGALYAAVSQAHEHPRCIALAATAGGQVLVWVAATALLAPTSFVYVVAPSLLAVLAAPPQRNAILSVASIAVLYGRLVRHDVHGVPLVAAFVVAGVLLSLCFLAAASYRQLPQAVQRNPQVVLHAAVCAALAATWLVPPLLGGYATESAGAHALRWLLPFLLWRCGYLLLSGRRGSVSGTRFVDHVFYCLPAYGGTNVPYGKGHDHLARQRADTPEALARTRLAGLKLLVLAWCWTALLRLLAACVYGEPAMPGGDLLVQYGLGIPRLRRLIASGGTVALPVAWLSLLFELVDATLTLAVSGHLIIGCLRLFGYGVFRNTYKPLLAQSIVEFWNRFYYYFKELLVEFFFFPAYVSYFKARPRLRIVTATMAAALFGNVYYHALRDIEDLVRAGWTGAWAQLSPRLFYSLLLTAGICVSMLREQQRRGSAAPATSWPTPRAARRIAGVWLFYSLIHIWNIHPIALTFTQRTHFFLSLFGLR